MMSGPMKALLGALAVAGYQNRDKIAEVLRGLQNRQPQNVDPSRPNENADGGLGGLSGGQGGLGDLLRGLTTGGILSGGLGDLLKTFQQNGHGDKADTWVQPGANAPIERDQLSEALGPDVIDELIANTGLSREDILERLKRDLPTAVDDLTPDGRVPSEEDDFLRSASALSKGRTA